MGLFSLIGGIIGGGSQKKAIKKGTQAQVDAFNKGIAEQQRQFDLTRADFKPYLTAGTGAIGGIGDLLGLNGNDKASAAITALQASPMYQSLFNNGLEALNQNASATGGLRGGNMQGATLNFGRDTLSSVIADRLSSLGGLAGLGEGATDSVAGFGQNKANAITGLLSNIGGAKASGDYAIGGINAKNWQNAGSFLDQVASAIMGMPGMPGAQGGSMSGFGSIF